MKKEYEKLNIKSEILYNYVNTIISIKSPMSDLKRQINEILNSKEKKYENISMELISIIEMYNEINRLILMYPNERGDIYKYVMDQIMQINNGIITTRMIELLNISRQYLSIMERDNKIEKISRGVYILSSSFEDSFFVFQQKYKKTIFSHMNALYFHGLTEEYPYKYTVTVPRSYHDKTVNDKCDVFYVADNIYEIGAIEVETPNGNRIRIYDKERCICDIIRSKNRMDREQFKKAIREYEYSKDKNLMNLSIYAAKMGISKDVMEIVGG